MTFNIGPRIVLGLLTAGLAFCAAAAEAANGFSITQNDEARAAVGMSEAEVRQNLGPPARTRQYRDGPGPTWTYEVQAAPFGRTDFDIDFGADGKVASVGERLYGSRH
jgi:hypothetical protein